MDSLNLVHSHNGMYSVIKKMKFEGKWMKLEAVIPSEVTQTQEDKYYMFPLISEGYKRKSSKEGDMDIVL